MDRDIYVNGAAVGIVARTDLPAAQVYKVTKTFWENAEAMKASTPWMKNITVQYAVKEGGMKLHPGAQRYYEEVGVAIPAGSKN